MQRYVFLCMMDENTYMREREHDTNHVQTFIEQFSSNPCVHNQGWGIFVNVYRLLCHR
jgi:hypothetical protein